MKLSYNKQSIGLLASGINKQSIGLLVCGIIICTMSRQCLMVLGSILISNLGLNFSGSFPISSLVLTNLRGICRSIGFL